MDNNEDIIIDEWELKLDGKLKELNICQNEKGFNSSCNACEQFFDCKLRKDYVLAVYGSMNKGSGGGFEF